MPRAQPVDNDFTALASRVAASGELRACLILSRDGLVLGAFPPNGEAEVRPAWLKVSAFGEPERGFIEFPAETWAFLHRGPYIAFAVGSPGSRAGVILDHLEQALLVAEESRARREAVRTPDAIDLARPGPRASLHPEVHPEAHPESGSQPHSAEEWPAPLAEPVAATPDGEPVTAPVAAPAAAVATPPAETEEVDRVTLAFELSNLLQEGYSRDE